VGPLSPSSARWRACSSTIRRRRVTTRSPRSVFRADENAHADNAPANDALSDDAHADGAHAEYASTDSEVPDRDAIIYNAHFKDTYADTLAPYCDSTTDNFLAYNAPTDDAFAYESLADVAHAKDATADSEASDRASSDIPADNRPVDGFPTDDTPSNDELVRACGQQSHQHRSPRRRSTQLSHWTLH